MGYIFQLLETDAGSFAAFLLIVICASIHIYGWRATFNSVCSYWRERNAIRPEVIARLTFRTLEECERLYGTPSASKRHPMDYSSIGNASDY